MSLEYPITMADSANNFYNNTKLLVSGYQSTKVDTQDIANELKGCLPVRFNERLDDDNLVIEFKSVDKSEKALTLYSDLHLTSLNRNLKLLPIDSEFNVINIHSNDVNVIPKIFRNLPSMISTNEIYDLIRPYGPIKSINIINSGVAVVYPYDNDTSNKLESELHCSEVEGQTISVTTYLSSNSNGNEFNAKAPAFIPSSNKFLQSSTAPFISPPSPSPSAKANNNNANAFFGHGPGQQVQFTGTNLIDPCNLFCKNLDPNLSSNDLFDQFKRFGHIVSARIMRDENGHSRGFGFVSYQSPQSAKAAMHAMNGVNIGDRAITVRLHEPKQLRQEKLAARFNNNNHNLLTPSPGLDYSPSSPLPSEYGMMMNDNHYLASPPLSTTPLGQRRGSGSYFKAALSSNVTPTLDEFKAMTNPVRNELLAGHLTRKLDDVGNADQELIEKVITSLKLDECVNLLNETNENVSTKVNEIKHSNNYNYNSLQLGLNNSLKIDNNYSRAPSIISNTNEMNVSNISERERLIKAVESIGESDSEKVGELLNGLGKKERALCLFSNDYLIQKVRDAKVVIETMAEEELEESNKENKNNDADKLTAAKILTKAVSDTPNIVNEDIYKLNKNFYESIESLELKTQKQKIGEKLFKKLKSLGFKNNSPKLTINLLDNEDLKSLLFLSECFPEQLKLIAEPYSKAI